MNNFFQVLLSILFLTTTASAQGTQISLHGTIDSSIINFFNSRELLVKVHDPIKKLLNNEEIITVPIQEKGKFQLQISSTTPFTYLSFWAKDNKSGSGARLPIQFQARNANFLEEQYFFQQGDSIKMFISKNGNMGFSGKGSEKLKYQNYVFNLPGFLSLIQRRSTELINLRDYALVNELEDQVLELECNLRRKLLESYQQQFSPDVYQLLQLDANSSAAYLRLRSNALVPNGSNDVFIQQYYKNHVPERHLSATGPKLLSSSPYYLEYLLLRELQLEMYTESKNNSGNIYPRLLITMNNKYSGELKDQLLLLLVTKSPEESIKPIIDKIINLIGDQTIKNALGRWKDKQSASAFPFELQDVNGKRYHLKDFEGKVLVMDFWFTGCAACMQLNAAMEKIMQHYKNNKQVVFVTVSSDNNKESWEKSLFTGRYTSEGTINLYTNGLGMAHPLLKYYNFQGAPRQLIINKKGKLVSSAPPRADIETKVDNKNSMVQPASLNANSRALIKLIDQLL
ncbi:hypothetical protein CPT03_13390 [Pedobacter ginsengisoli]|uniref:Thioredoxin domain-containing protein n=1 Tax=Pedobacter ginsengisoli TaxID=363852 RepID=A0A2D1U703_9SPHI|nr:TlpA disulfide reductase family protein [Pedobacter ginsengisoli]ATP57391.1 hypothetical protein CPT03_13390 [Pedobacter ginsengisoli]